MPRPLAIKKPSCRCSQADERDNRPGRRRRHFIVTVTPLRPGTPDVTGALKVVKPGVLSWYVYEPTGTPAEGLLEAAPLAGEYSAEVVEVTSLAMRDVSLGTCSQNRRTTSGVAGTVGTAPLQRHLPKIGAVCD